MRGQLISSIFGSRNESVRPRFGLFMGINTALALLFIPYKMIDLVVLFLTDFAVASGRLGITDVISNMRVKVNWSLAPLLLQLEESLQNVTAHLMIVTDLVLGDSVVLKVAKQ